MWVPFWTLFKKEVIRFLKVWMHTVLAPVLTGGLYLFVFGEALSKHLPVYEGVTYTAFIIPGLIMMTVLQNAFSNTASSLIQSKISGNLVFILLPAIPGPLPISARASCAQRSPAPGSICSAPGGHRPRCVNRGSSSLSASSVRPSWRPWVSSRRSGPKNTIRWER